MTEKSTAHFDVHYYSDKIHIEVRIDGDEHEAIDALNKLAEFIKEKFK